MRSAPSDWPKAGSIDLQEQDPPHRSSEIEWWYLNCHLDADDGRKFALFSAFFRVIAGRDEATGQPVYAHSLTWALTDIGAGRYYPDSRVDATAPEIGLRRINGGHGTTDQRINRATAEILERGKVPLPDRPFHGAVTVAENGLALSFGGSSLTRCEDGRYHLKLFNPNDDLGCELLFEPLRPAVRQGAAGVVKGSAGERMFYYSIPRCAVAGTLLIGGDALKVKHGQGWYDHQFGGRARRQTADQWAGGKRAGGQSASAPMKAGEELNLAWNWLAVQLDDGTDICAYDAVDAVTGKAAERLLMIVAPNGRRRMIEAFSLQSNEPWRSTRTFQEYPTRFRLAAAGLSLDLDIRAAAPDQEFITVIARPAFWEGSCSVRGTLQGRAVSGVAFVERNGFGVIDDLDLFSDAVAEEVRASIDKVLPRVPNYEQMRALVAAEDRDEYMVGVDLPSLAENLIAPLREIVDRGGKSWRSYAALACCDAVGGDSRRYVQWLAAPELLHVGSMVVDDVQDRSQRRRGGPTAHLIYGEAKAINAGTAAYFIAERVLADNDLSTQQRLRVYEQYFLAMRAGHAGQAIDHGGMEALLPAAVATGDISELERRILACYRLKTAVPAASLAAVGAIAGGGSDAQIRGVADYIEALALGFQITDDVLGLRGFEGDRKPRGEDVMNGLVTLPVARGLERLSPARRQWLWQTVRAKPTERKVVAAVVGALERCGAIESCTAFARDLVDRSWKSLEPLLEPSFASLMLRAFGWFAVERRR